MEIIPLSPEEFSEGILGSVKVREKLNRVHYSTTELLHSAQVSHSEPNQESQSQFLKRQRCMFS